MNFDSDTNVVDVAIRRLRKKVDDPFPTPLIHTVRGSAMSLKSAPDTSGGTSISGASGSRMAPSTCSASRGSWSIATRLTVLYSALTFGLLALGSGFLFWVLTTNLNREDNDALADKISVLRAIAARPDDLKELSGEVQWEGAKRQFTAFYIRILDTKRRVLVETPHMSRFLSREAFPHPAEIEDEPTAGSAFGSTEGKTYWLMAAWARHGHGEPRLIQAALDRSDEEHLIADYREKTIYVLAVGLLLCAGPKSRAACSRRACTSASPRPAGPAS